MTWSASHHMPQLIFHLLTQISCFSFYFSCCYHMEPCNNFQHLSKRYKASALVDNIYVFFVSNIKSFNSAQFSLPPSLDEYHPFPQNDDHNVQSNQMGYWAWHLYKIMCYNKKQINTKLSYIFTSHNWTYHSLGRPAVMPIILLGNFTATKLGSG